MVNVNSECASKFKSLKDDKSPKYIIFGLYYDITEIVVEKTSDATGWDDCRRGLAHGCLQLQVDCLLL